MDRVLDVDWRAFFVPTVGLLELVLRASVIYLGILAALRIFRRDAGALNMADLLVAMLVADAAQNAMSEQLRKQGVERLDQVKRCYLEPDGGLSVIRAEGGGR